jgi:hypothetical protein
MTTDTTKDTKPKRFAKPKFVQQAYDHSAKLATKHTLNMGHGTQQLLGPRPKKSYTFTEAEMQAFVIRAVGYGEALAFKNVATWVDDGNFGL